MNKENLLQKFDEVVADFTVLLQEIPQSKFFTSTDGKWSAGEHVQHLVQSVKPVNMALRLPPFILLIFGKPNRSGRSYEEIREKYRSKLTEGAVAAGRYVPKLKSSTRADVEEEFLKHHRKLINLIKNSSESYLDNYLLPHPILGKLTIREMLYFTLYHIKHHLKAVEKMKWEFFIM